MLFQASHPPVICVGSVSQDIFFPTDEGLVIETPDDLLSKRKIAFELGGKYRVADRFESVGGVAANVAHGLTRLGQPAACYSMLGSDAIGRWILEEFRRATVSTELLRIDSAARTDLSAIVVMTQNGERTIFHNRDANELLEIHEEQFTAARWVFISALNGDWKGNLRTLLDCKRRYGFSLAFNPGQHNIREDGSMVAEALGHSELLFLNKDEALELVGKLRVERVEDPEDELGLLRALHQAGASRIGMTDGIRGAWSFDGRACWHCPIDPTVRVVDSTGAGDAFSSGFFSAYLEGHALPQALTWGIANSGNVIGAYGAIAGLLDKNEMERSASRLIPKRVL